MIFISSLLGCRSCQQSDGTRRMYILQEGEPEVYKKKTEYEVMALLERWRSEDKKVCPFCGSSNVEVHEVQINNHPLYEFDRLAEECKSNSEFMLILNIDKQGSEISMKIGGSKRFPSDFIGGALQKVVDTIENRPDNNFISHSKGNFFICITNKIDIIRWENHFNVQRFRNSGLTRNELLDKIKPLTNQIAIK